VKVDLVLDPEFGERAARLSESQHVWIVASPTNAPVIRRLRKADGPEWTTFDAKGESGAALCASIAELVDEHHRWSEIEVHGAALDEHLRDAFRALGETEVRAARNGFVARR